MLNHKTIQENGRTLLQFFMGEKKFFVTCDVTGAKNLDPIYKLVKEYQSKPWAWE